jgi:3-hydroxybutyryl-CoA dehydrogenase
MNQQPLQIAVIGAGTMGNGIAHVFAQYGFSVNLIDVSHDALQKAIQVIGANFDRQVKKELVTEAQKNTALGLITMHTDLAQGVKAADYVVEAASEQLEIKLAIFKALDQHCKPSAILASNTSSISITKIAAATQRPGHVIGMHFMNPVPVMKLVEVITGYATTAETLEATVALAKQLEKVPVKAHDYPGFVANRILMPMINEAIYTLYTGVAGVMEIDQIMKLGMSHPMGPLQLADFIGLDVCLSIMRVLHQGLGDSKYAPCPLLVNMVEAGQLGVKSGRGFYDWQHGTKELSVAPYFSGK